MLGCMFLLNQQLQEYCHLPQLIGSILCLMMVSSSSMAQPSSQWKPRVVMMPTLSSLVSPQVVAMTTCSDTSDGKVHIIMMMPTLSSLVTPQVVAMTTCSVTSDDDKVDIMMMMPTLSSLVTPKVVAMTTCSVTSDDKVGIMMTLGFQKRWGIDNSLVSSGWKVKFQQSASNHHQGIYKKKHGCTAFVPIHSCISLI